MVRRRLTPVRVNPVLQHEAEKRVSLAGEWRFRLDPDDQGLADTWYEDPGILRDTIEVPGAWQAQGFGNDEPQSVWDFGFSARTFRAAYTGTGWYGKTFALPDDWKGKRVWLHFGGVHPSAEVWLNGIRLGENNLPFVPFGFECTDVARCDRPNFLAVRVHEQNRALGFAYNWQGRWSGLYRSVELAATGDCFLEQAWMWPSAEDNMIRLNVRIGDIARARAPLVLVAAASPWNKPGEMARATFAIEQAQGVSVLPVATPCLWSPEAPNLYRVDVVLCRGDEVLDAQSERVGFVSLAGTGSRFLINGEPYYMRGTGDFISCPETGSPDTNRDRWRGKLRTLREYGYNMVRCQSYVYTPEYLDIADEVGLLVQSEMGMLGAWAGMSPFHYYTWPLPTPDWRPALKEQWDRVVMRDVNHPSANVYCMSNELGFFAYPRTARQCYRDTKAIKPTALVIWTDGRHNDAFPGDFVNAEASEKVVDKPLIQHEYRWWSSFPDVRLIPKYSGAVRPYAAEMALKAAQKHGIAHILPQAAANSQRLQFIEAKTKMEACRRDHAHLAGICHFNAMDANPSPQGIVDEFYERKYAEASVWRQTNGDTTILSSLGFNDRVLSAGEVFTCSLYVSDYSHPALKNPTLEWRLVSGKEVLARGRLHYTHQPFCTHYAGKVEASVPHVVSARPARLTAVLQEGSRTFTNEWNLWVFPQHAALPAGVGIYGDTNYTWLKTLQELPSIPAESLGSVACSVVLTECLDEPLVRFLRSGGRAILAASEGLVRPFPGKLGISAGQYFFTPPANYPPYEAGQDGTIIMEHPALGDIPHEGFADLQFYRMMADSPALDLEPLGLADGDPIIRAIHSYPVCRPLGCLAERRLDSGGIILCALDLNQAWPEARSLLASLCRYAAGHAFQSPLLLTDHTTRAVIEATALP